MAEWLEVIADSQGGYASRVTARGHQIAVDEPETAGGRDTGMMPTEVFCAALASCFCAALSHAAAKRGRELPGLEVKVRAERADGELRYECLTVEARSDLPVAELQELMGPARAVCWVSNTLAAGTAVSYRALP